MPNPDVIVIGGGAAGLMCALVAGRRGRHVIVLEGSNKIGKKILMSGGGRCNFTNLYTAPDRYISQNPKFCTSALSRYTQWDFIALVDKHGIAWHEKTLGQLFCNESSRQIVAMLADECQAAGVRIQTNCAVGAVSFHAGEEAAWRVQNAAEQLSAPALVLATGGLSIPKMGASDFGYRLARQFGLKLVETRAGLVPFTFSGATHELTGRLSGMSLPAVVSAGGTSFAENVLFTHRGLSGPAALQASNYWQPGTEILIDLVPAIDAAAHLLDCKRTQPKARLRSVLAHLLPRALVLELQNLLWTESSELALAEIPDASLRALAGTLHNWALRPSGTEGYRTAEVTLGGIDTDELSSQTMESKRQPGLYCIGEVVDVTGHLGGFNFQWAWASGYAAGMAV